MSKYFTAVKPKQDGFVALIVCILVAAILTLVSLSFVTIINRAQRQAVDNQLAAQALYAAESGINYAINAPVGDTNNTCVSGQVDPADPTFRYPCLIVDDDPTDLIFDSISQTTPTVFFMRDKFFDGDGASDINRLTVSWENAGTNPGVPPNESTHFGPCAGCPKFLSKSAWQLSGNKYIGVLEITIYPLLPSVGNINTASVRASARTFYLYPTNNVSATAPDVSYNDEGKIVKGNCAAPAAPDSPFRCRKVIIGQNGVNQITQSSKGYIVKLRGVYSNLKVRIGGIRPNGNQENISGAQKVIDVTGRANDVLKRVNVRVPLFGGVDFPSFALETNENICKRLSVYSGGALVDPECEN